jgi:signal peptidase I
VTIRLRRVAWWARQGLLTGGAVLGVLCILLTIGAAVLGVRPLVFESGSMSPTIDTGALAISHDVDAASLRAGQIVSVPTGTGERVTHRIVQVVRDGSGTAELELRGDANEVSDAHTYRVTHADRVLFDIPLAGYAVGWLVGPVGLFLLGLYVAFLLSVLLKGSSRDASPPQQGPTPEAAPLERAPERLGPEPDSRAEPLTAADRRPPRGAPGHAGVAVLGLVMLAALATEVVVPLRVTPTLAAFTDQVALSGSRLTAQLPAPANVTCAKGNGRRTVFNWGPVTLAGYTVHYDDIPGSVTASLPAGTTTFTSQNKDVGTFWVVATRAFSGQPWTSADSVHYAYDNGVCTLL